MVEIDGEMKKMEGLEDFHEASWVHKRNGIYYLSYSDNHDVAGKHNQMRYATSKSPLGPWTKFNGNPILSRKNIGINGTGHGDFFSDEKGKLYYVLHTHHSETQVSKRRTAVISVDFNKSTTGSDVPIPDFKSFHFLETKK